MRLYLLTRGSPSLLSHAVFLSLTLQTTLLFLISGVCLGGDVLSPGPVYGAVGGSVWINTTIRPADTPLRFVRWTFTESHVITLDHIGLLPEPVYRDRVRLDTHTGSLQLMSLTMRDSGEYTVSITKTEGDPEDTGMTALKVLAKKSGRGGDGGDGGDGVNDTGGGVVGGVIGGVVVVVLIVAVIVYLHRKKHLCFKEYESAQTGENEQGVTL